MSTATRSRVVAFSDGSTAHAVDLRRMTVAVARTEEEARRAIGAAGGPAAPPRSDLPAWGATVVLSHRCNITCVYCFSQANTRGPHLELRRALTAIDLALRHRPDGARTFTVTFFGGEPTLSMDVVREVVDHVRRRAADEGATPAFSLVTNGTAPLDVMRYLLDEDVQVIVSMDSRPDIQGGQRIYTGSTAVEDTVATIRLLAERQPGFRVRSTVTGETVGRMSQTVAYFAELGARFVHFSPVGPSSTVTPGRSRRYTQPSAQDYAAGFAAALDSARACGSHVLEYAIQHLVGEPRSYCAPMSGSPGFVTLNADGAVIMCPEVQGAAQNDRLHLRIGEITHHGVRIDGPHRHHVADREAPARRTRCEGCPVRAVCAGACPVRHLQHDSGHDDYTCDVSRLIISDVLARIAAQSLRGARPQGAPPQVAVLRLPPEIASPPLRIDAVRRLGTLLLLDRLAATPSSLRWDDEIDRLRALPDVR